MKHRESRLSLPGWLLWMRVDSTEFFLLLGLVCGVGANRWGCFQSTLTLFILLTSSVLEDDSWNTADLLFSADSSDWPGKAHPSGRQ